MRIIKKKNEKIKFELLDRIFNKIMITDGYMDGHTDLLTCFGKRDSISLFAYFYLTTSGIYVSPFFRSASNDFNSVKWSNGTP